MKQELKGQPLSKQAQAETKKIKNSTKSYDFDAIIIGTGPGGEGAAMNLAKRDKRVAIIERYHNVGGGCTHWGTIPSKALRQSVSRLIEYNSNPLFNAGQNAKLLAGHFHMSLLSVHR